MTHQFKKKVEFRGWTFVEYELVDMTHEQVLLDLNKQNDKNI